jgi:methylated-DNA-protein-cysteine methyltransferase-like protein
MVSPDRQAPNFFARVYQVVRMIPHGRVATYGQIAAIVGDRRAARTVGWALNALREGTEVPWHRVINAQGMISTRYRERAAAAQRVLLESEGIQFDAQGRIDMHTHQWEGLEWPEIEALRQEWNAKPPKL